MSFILNYIWILKDTLRANVMKYDIDNYLAFICGCKNNKCKCHYYKGFFNYYKRKYRNTHGSTVVAP